MLAGLGLGCSQEKITSYRVPKETNEAAAMAGPGVPSLPHLEWELPAGWTAKPADSMRVASFDIKGPNGELAEVSVVPLPGVSNPDIPLQSVNMWREKIALKPISQEDLGKIEKSVEVAGAPAKFYDMVGEPSSGGQTKPRVAAAILPRNGTLWFFKMAGEDGAVAAQKDAFLGFLKSITFHEAEASSTVAGSGTPRSANPRKPRRDSEPSPTESWKIPAGWKEQTPGAMVLASYAVPGENGASAEVSISMFPGGAGGLLANVNRWRGQLSSAPVTDDDLPKMTSALDLGDAKATLVDMNGKSAKTGKEARLFAAIVPRDGNTWFYKLMGDEKLVEREKPAFLEFIKTAH